jgi:hypothetical protein
MARLNLSDMNHVYLVAHQMLIVCTLMATLIVSLAIPMYLVMAIFTLK